MDVSACVGAAGAGVEMDSFIGGGEIRGREEVLYGGLGGFGGGRSCYFLGAENIVSFTTDCVGSFENTKASRSDL